MYVPRGIILHGITLQIAQAITSPHSKEQMFSEKGDRPLVMLDLCIFQMSSSIDLLISNIDLDIVVIASVKRKKMSYISFSLKLWKLLVDRNKLTIGPKLLKKELQ